MKKITIALLAATTPTLLIADNFVYNAEVLRTEAITVREVSDTPDPHCYSKKPVSFTELLQWDVTCEQPRLVERNVFEVTYKIDNNEFTTVVDNPPGDFIPVRLSFEPYNDYLAQRSGYE
ncbi:MAG: hypothetical protein HOC70_03215 [Gammaproteobacteria bacterium]|jgi:hypothetical protein|nr:hypothetical protein [Gammaproteobacteria bacterium]MBT4492226.1 hypothetical protein [Gammaproteobacteria bacterium]MBT7371836.1 hypothetical protein [Gammaproteobacteria bacterium]